MERSKEVISDKWSVIRDSGVASQLCKAVLVFLVIVSCFLVITPATAEEPELGDSAEGVFTLSLNEVTELALINNFDIQLAKYDIQIARTGEDTAESIYDLILKAGVSYNDDQSARTNTFAGTKNLENEYSLGLSQKTPFGITVDIDGVENRTWTDSSFANLNPAHDSSLKMTWRQDLGRNILGIQDRGTIKISLLDIENSEYTSLEKIEGYIADVQRAYWDLVLAIAAEDIEVQMVEQAKKLYDLHLDQIQHGLVESPELYASEANYRARTNQYILLHDRRLNRENILKLLLNLSEDESVRIDPKDRFDVREQHHNKDQSLKAAFSNRRDYKRATNELKSKNILLAMNKNSLWPEIDLEISFARNGVGPHFSSAFSDIGGEDNPNFFVGTTITFPLQNREARAELSSTEFKKAQAIVQMKQLERKIAIEIIDQVRHCNVRRDSAVNRERIALLQNRKLEEEAKRFKFGRSDTDTIIRFQEDLIQAQLLAAQAQFDYYASEIDLKLKENSLLTHYWDEKI